jgi:RNA polymerase subunit RPABC4/transcription elongation factor Spt4
MTLRTMGQLDETRFEAAVGPGCPACGSTTLDLFSFLDRRLDIMLGDPNNEGRWAHDGEKFIDGTYRIACASCARVVFDDDACPRCHAAGGLARALGDKTRLAVPRRCPSCNETELVALALIAATARASGGKAPSPRPLGELGDPGYHIVAYACESCDAAVVAQACPLCDGPGPLRPRP